MGKQIKTQEPTAVDWSVFVVHPAHEYATDEVYHDVMNTLSHLEWQTAMQIATEVGHSENDVKKALRRMLKDGEKRGDVTLEEARSDEGKCYRFAGASRREEA